MTQYTVHHTGLDRSAHRRDDREWLEAAWLRARVILIGPDGKSLVAATGLMLVPSEGLQGEPLFLGVDASEVPYFAVAMPLPEEGKHLWEIGHELSAFDAQLFAQALGLVQWHNDHRFSPGSGAPTMVEHGGWVRRDESGGLHFPRTDPAVIMLVHDGVSGSDGRALLGSGAMWAPAPAQVRRYSTLAGFVEPGETAEAAVAREVFEETGVRVTAVSYVGSQPHPYPRSLMLGFVALADPGEAIHIDPVELADARWFTRAEVAAVVDGSAGGFRLPNPSSIAYRLVMGWLHAD